jgi:hypothetical protein
MTCCRERCCCCSPCPIIPVQAHGTFVTAPACASGCEIPLECSVGNVRNICFDSGSTCITIKVPGIYRICYCLQNSMGTGAVFIVVNGEAKTDSVQCLPANCAKETLVELCEGDKISVVASGTLCAGAIKLCISKIS